jgi:hypothetical protein
MVLENEHWQASELSHRFLQKVLASEMTRAVNE